MDNTFGNIFRVTTFGESHGKALGVVIDGCPPGYRISWDRVQKFLARRRPGQSHLTSPRDESDEVVVMSGVEHDVTLGTPMCLVVFNQNAKPNEYKKLRDVFRPSHADFTTLAKYGLRPGSGGGRASARETIGRVAAAAVAEQILEQRFRDFSVVAFVSFVKDIGVNNISVKDIFVNDLGANFAQKRQKLSRQVVDKNILRTIADKKTLAQMIQCIEAAKSRGDSVGGVITAIASGVPVGLGAPVFDKLEADLGKAMLSLPATKGFEIGSGFGGTKLFGSEHNDAFIQKGGKVKTATNFSGGIQGGISNGEDIIMNVAFKPVATLFQPQKTVDRRGQSQILHPKEGRHDPCVLPRAVPMVEAMAILTIMDHWLRQAVIVATRGPEADYVTDNIADR